MTSGKPHVILLAVRCDIRYTPEEYAIYRQVKEIVDDGLMCQRLVVAFTFGDRQDEDIEEDIKVGKTAGTFFAYR